MGRRSNFTARQKAEIVLSVLSKQITIAEACRRHGIIETTFACWREQAVEGDGQAFEGGGGREVDDAGGSAVKSLAAVDLRQRVTLSKQLAGTNRLHNLCNNQRPPHRGL